MCVVRVTEDWVFLQRWGLSRPCATSRPSILAVVPRTTAVAPVNVSWPRVAKVYVRRASFSRPPRVLTCASGTGRRSVCACRAVCVRVLRPRPPRTPRGGQGERVAAPGGARVVCVRLSLPPYVGGSLWTPGPPTGGWTWHIAAGAANCVDAQPFDDVVAAATGELEEGGHHARASPRAASSPAGACSCLWVCSRASSFLLVRQVVVTFRCGCCVCGGGVVAACLCAADVECGSVTGSPQCALLASVLSDAVPLQSFDMEWPFDELFDVDFPLDLSHLAGPAAH